MRIPDHKKWCKTVFWGSCVLALCACASEGDFPDIADVPPRPVVTESPADLEREIEAMDAERQALERQLAVIRQEQNAEAEVYGE